MKKITILILLTLAVLSSCQRDETITPDSEESDVSLELNIPQSLTVETKATADEMKIVNLWVFTFDSNNKLTSKNKATIISGTKANVSLQKGSGINIYVCANASATEEAIFGKFVENVTTPADLQAITIGKVPMPGFPMSGQVFNQTINSSTATINITLTRLAARLDVIGPTNIVAFGASITKILNTADAAPLFTGDVSPVPAAKIINAGTGGTPSSLYLYENAITASTEEEAESRATAIIIKGTYRGFVGYYKLRIKYGSPVKYDINRNTYYTINISNVSAPGFATVEEAEAHKPQNVDYNITVTDSDTYDTFVSNGQYYLASTNSSYISVGGKTGDQLKIATIKHPAVDPSLVSNGTITTTGGLTIVGGGVLLSANETRDIVATFPPFFKSGLIIVRWGNLMTEINVSNETSQLSSTISKHVIYNKDYCRVEVPANASWVWLGSAANNKKKVPAGSSVDIKGNVNITLEQVRNTKHYPRTTELMVRSTYGMTTKVVLTQFSNVNEIGFFAGWQEVSPGGQFQKKLGVDRSVDASTKTWRASSATPLSRNVANSQEDGLSNIDKLRSINNNSNLQMHPATNYCLMKNDLSGNGSIEDDEPIDWYLPAQNQLIGILLTQPSPLQPSNTWSSTEYGPNRGMAYKLNPSDPYMSSAAPYNKDDKETHVRCVRDLD